MLKHLIVLVALSVLIIVSMSYAQLAVQLLLDAHEWITQVLADVFSTGQSGSVAKGLLGLLAIPFIAAMAPTIIYWLVRRHWFPYFLEIIWVVWLVQAGALLMAQKAVA